MRADDTEDVTTDATAERTGAHPLDAVSLVAGLVAVALALASLLDLDVDAAVVLPLLLVGAGLVGVLSALRRDRG